MELAEILPVEPSTPPDVPGSARRGTLSPNPGEDPRPPPPSLCISAALGKSLHSLLELGGRWGLGPSYDMNLIPW